ncbi:MAG: M50 family metallopeptidase [bacterium]
MIFIAFFSLIVLVVIHEFAHFFSAKKFGMKVEEFGIGYPPRVYGKKIKDTLYSLNLIPFGAFVRFPDEIKAAKEDKFSQQSVGKRIIVTLAGVVSFWVTAAILFSIVLAIGARVAVDDNATGLINPQVQILGVSSNSPAEKAGIQPGDTIMEMAIGETIKEITRVIDVQDFTNAHLGEEMEISLQRGKETIDVVVVPRVSPPKDDGAIGLSLSLTAIERYPWYQSPWKGIVATFDLTKTIILGYSSAISSVFSGAPSGIEAMGPVGIVRLVSQMGKLGIAYLLQFIGMISVYMAIFNALPIPVTDGGKAVFLIIEKIRKKALKPELEQKIDAFFFAALILLMVLVTIKDIRKFF